jgi:glycosyltransferase 2 family protein
MHSQEMDPDVRNPRSTFARRMKLFLGYLIAVLCLAWVLYNVHTENLLQNILHLKWRLILLAIAVDNLNYIAQALRWNLLLRPVAHVGAVKSVQATYVGVFTSNVLPMRLGEIVRAYLISKWYSKKFSQIIPSMVVEHLFEGIWLALGIGLATFFLPLPSYIRRGAQIFEFGVIVLAGIFVYALMKEDKFPADHHRERLSEKLAHKFSHFMEQMTVGMKRIGLTPTCFLALFVTLASLMLQALALWLTARAYSIPLDLWMGGIVLVIIRVGVVIPNAPANIGTYQFFATMGLELLGVNRSISAGFAIVLFFVSMTPTCIIGFIALSKSGTTLLRLQHEAQEAAKE